MTGTTWSGTVASGEAVRILPGGREARVRSIESHGRAVEAGQARCRTALGLAGIERAQVRGDSVVRPGDAWAPTTALDVELELLAVAPRGLAARTRVRVHLGTAEVLARVHPRGSIDPGGGDWLACHWRAR